MPLGQCVLDIPPAQGNPRNSEGAFLTLHDGGLLFAYSRFAGESADDHARADIVAIRSWDHGATWTQPETVLSARALQAMNVMSLSLLRMRNGGIGLFYLNRQSWQDMRPELRISLDEGKSWGAPMRCIRRPGYFVMNNDRVVRLKTGRILLPVAQHAMTVHPETGALERFGPGVGYLFFSDDDGLTWQEGDFPLAMQSPYAWGGFQEPGVIELSGGLVACWGRTVLGRQYACFSRTQGQRFSPLEPSWFTSPLSPLSAKRLSDGRLLSVWNPVPDYPTRSAYPRTGGRTPLVYALSSDDGVNWSEPKTIEADPHAGYCYTAIHEADGYVFLAYCAGNTDVDGACLNRTRIRRFAMTAL